MAKIGSFEYPDFHFKSLIEAMDILVNKFNGKVSSSKTFAEALKHKSDKSGAFLRKVADLRRYGLIEKRELIATNIGKRIAKPIKGESERKENYNLAIKNMPLWIKLFERLKTKTPNLDEFKLQLAEVTQDEDETRKNADKIRNLYIEAMSYYTDSLEAENSGNYSNYESSSNISDDKRINDKKMEVIKYQNIRIELPREVRSIETAKKLLNMLKEDIEENVNQNSSED